MKDHPDVAWQEVLTHAAELRLLTVRKGMVFADEAGARTEIPAQGEDKQMATWAPGGTFQTPIGKRPPLVNTRAAQYALLRARGARQQVVDQTTMSLAIMLSRDRNRLRAIPIVQIPPDRGGAIGSICSAAITRRAASRSIATSTRSASSSRPRWPNIRP